MLPPNGIVVLFIGSTTGYQSPNHLYIASVASKSTPSRCGTPERSAVMLVLMRMLTLLLQSIRHSSVSTMHMLNGPNFASASVSSLPSTETPSSPTSDRRDFLQKSSSASLAILAGATSVTLLDEPQAASAANAINVVLPGERQPQEPRNRRMGGLAAKIRTVGNILDELQRDLMQERWDLVEGYPAQLRSYVPVFTTYTDTAFASDAPTDKGLRVALRYEVGRLFAGLERFKGAASRRALPDAYAAYAEMALHFDRYLRVGGLYSYYDDVISTEPYFQGVADSTLVFADPKKDPPLIRDLIVLVAGPDKGKTGIVLAPYSDGSQRTVVKMDRYKGMREIKVVPNTWVAKRLGEQAPDDVFLIPRKE